MGQLFNSSLDISCIANKSIPILSLKLENLCFLYDRLERVTKPYSENGCDIVATGVANHFRLPYTPLPSPLALHILWVTGEEVTWVPITREYLISNELLCLRNYQTDILQHKENQLIGSLNEYYTLLENLQGIFDTKYFDIIINSAKEQCASIRTSLLGFQTAYIYCLKDELRTHVSNLSTIRER